MTYTDRGLRVETTRIPTVAISYKDRSAFLQGDEAAEFIDYAMLVADGPFGRDRSLNQVVCSLAVDYLP
jgi:hypothetical protein